MSSLLLDAHGRPLTESNANKLVNQGADAVSLEDMLQTGPEIEASSGIFEGLTGGVEVNRDDWDGTPQIKIAHMPGCPTQEYRGVAMETVMVHDVPADELQMGLILSGDIYTLAAGMSRVLFTINPPCHPASRIDGDKLIRKAHAEIDRVIQQLNNGAAHADIVVN